MYENKQITEVDFLRFLLDYEIRSSWWAPLISWGWLQRRISKYFIWKTKRKMRRYKESKEYQIYFKTNFGL